uniref:Uncharacterized protein n=1 Tax=Meloidogyne incognita TaxID=6306 RepID=A0A914LFR8_MELIC
MLCCCRRFTTEQSRAHQERRQVKFPQRMAPLDQECQHQQARRGFPVDRRCSHKKQATSAAEFVSSSEQFPAAAGTSIEGGFTVTGVAAIVELNRLCEKMRATATTMHAGRLCVNGSDWSLNLA